MNLEFYSLTCKVSGDLRNHEVAFLASLPKIEYTHLEIIKIITFLQPCHQIK